MVFSFFTINVFYTNCSKPFPNLKRNSFGGHSTFHLPAALVFRNENICVFKNTLIKKQIYIQ